MSVVKNKNGRGILLAMVHAIQQNKQLLGDVDGLIGDGDHGMNMNKGFTLYEEQLGDQDTSLSDGLFDLGSVLLNKMLTPVPVTRLSSIRFILSANMSVKQQMSKRIFLQHWRR